MNFRFKISLSFLCLHVLSVGSFLHAQTLEEKQQALQLSGGSSRQVQLDQVNRDLRHLKKNLGEHYSKVHRLIELKAPEEEFQELLKEVNEVKQEVLKKEEAWKSLCEAEFKKDDETYAFWDQEDTTLAQLVMEYGSGDFLYIVPHDLQSTKINMYSSLPVPRESWGDLLEIILAQNGVGVKQLNPYTRQLYLLKQDLIAVHTVANNVKDLEKIAPHSRIIFIFSPPAEQTKSVGYFFERFRDPKRTFVTQIGSKVAIVASKEEVEKLMALYDAVWEKESERMTKVVPLKRMTPLDMEKVLKSYFGDLTDKNRLSLAKSGEELTIMTLSHEASLVLIGVKEIVKKAEEVINETENQISNPSEMTVHWYTCRHSDPVDICDVLEKVYVSLIFSGTASGEKDLLDREFPQQPPETPLEYPSPAITYGPAGPLPVVNPPSVVAGRISDQKKKSSTINFIPYPKTGSIMMVVRRDTLDRIKELLKKLDVPKKMVHIEVLLFEKIIKNQNNFGLNVLKIGAPASGIRETGLQYESQPGSFVKGVLQFILQRPKSSHFPAFDVAYNFLMSQEDMRVNASPSVTTVNQVPAKISIVEELSVNNGAAPIETNTGITFENSFTRNQYGINLVMTPTIHDSDPEDIEQKRYITLETNVNFDTINSDINDRPKVNRRSIENQVRVLDGETIILGGLRKKTGEDNTEKIPFLGEIPGLGKLFGTSRLKDELTEMIIFITPHILNDQKAELEKFRDEELRKRPGDLPEFFKKILEARSREKTMLFENSFKLLFGSNESYFRP